MFRPLAESGILFLDHTEYVAFVRFSEIPPTGFFRGPRIDIIGQATTMTVVQASGGEVLVIPGCSVRPSGRGAYAQN